MKKTLLKSAAITASVFALGLAAVACGPDDDSTKKPNGNDVYTVTYDLNGGTGTLPTESGKKKGERFKLADGDGLKNGEQILAGWHDGTKQYDPDEWYTMPAHAVTFTARWKDDDAPVVKYNVTYKYGAAGADVVKNDQNAKNYAVEAPVVYEDTGNDEYYKIFAGWKVEGDSTVYLPGVKHTLTDNTTFTAQWVDFDDDYYWRDTSNTLQLFLLTDSVGAYIYKDTADKFVWTYFAYAVKDKAITLTPVDGKPIEGTYDKTEGELTLSIKVGLLTYDFEAEEPPATGVPTFTFQLNGGTGSAPTLTVTEDMYNANTEKYAVVMPPNSIDPPDGKQFKRWLINDGKTELPCNAGNTYQADAGQTYTVKPEWEDAAPDVAEGTDYYGNCVIRDNNPFAPVNVTVKAINFDVESEKMFYRVGDSLSYVKSRSVSNENTDRNKPNDYGADAKFYEVKIENCAVYLLLAADGSKLKLFNTSYDPITDGEFLSESETLGIVTVTFKKPDGAKGENVVVKVEMGGHNLIACPFEKDDYVFLGWKKDGATIGSPLQPGTNVPFSEDTSYTAVFGKVYTNVKSNATPYSVTLRDDGFVLWTNSYGDTQYCSYAVEDGIVAIDAYVYLNVVYEYGYLELDGNKFTVLDELYGVSFTAANDVTLKFDGKGKATLGTDELAYEYFYDERTYDEGFYLTIDGYHLRIVFDYDQELYKNVLNAKLTVNDVDYVFGTPATYTVTYNKPDGATGDDMDVVNVSAGTYTLADCDYEKDGWTFVGWLDENLGRYDDPVAIAAGATVSVMKNAGYVAVFAKVYINADDNNVTVALRDDEYVLWNLNGEPTYLYWEQYEDTVTIYGAFNAVYAYLEIEGNTYTAYDVMSDYEFTTKDGNTTLTFDGKGKATLGQHVGSYVPMMGNYGVEGVVLTFDGKDYECEFVYDNYYTAYIVVTVKVEDTDYVFDPYSKYTVSFEVGEGGTGTAPEDKIALSKIGETQASVTLPAGDGMQNEDSNKVFVGWKVKDGDDTVYEEGEKCNVSENTTFVAVWGVIHTYTVTYEAGGAEGTVPDPVQVSTEAGQDTAYVLLPAAKDILLVKSGYGFMGWRLKDNDDTIVYKQAYDNITYDITFVAVWGEIKSYNVSYEIGADVTGDVPTGGKVYTAAGSEEATVQLNNGVGLKVEGKVFKGWKIKNGDDTVYKLITTITADTTFVAYFEEDNGGDTGAKLYSYAGEGTAVTYGYDSADAAGDNAIKITTTNGTDRFFYFATASYTSGTAYTPYKLTISICFNTSTGKLSTTRIEVDGELVDPKGADAINLPNQEVKVIPTSSYGNEPLRVNFSMVNGKRAMTITVGDQEVTWFEIVS